MGLEIIPSVEVEFGLPLATEFKEFPRTDVETVSYPGFEGGGRGGVEVLIPHTPVLAGLFVRGLWGRNQPAFANKNEVRVDVPDLAFEHVSGGGGASVGVQLLDKFTLTGYGGLAAVRYEAKPASATAETDRYGNVETTGDPIEDALSQGGIPLPLQHTSRHPTGSFARSIFMGAELSVALSQSKTVVPTVTVGVQHANTELPTQEDAELLHLKTWTLKLGAGLRF